MKNFRQLLYNYINFTQFLPPNNTIFMFSLRTKTKIIVNIYFEKKKNLVQLYNKKNSSFL